MKITNEALIDIITEASYRLHSDIKRAYKSGKLEEYLDNAGMADLYPREEEVSLYETYPNGKIMIVGDSQIKSNEIYGCLKGLGIPKERVELYIDYEELKNKSFRHIQYNPNYRLILFGPVPHSGEGKKDQSSIITQVENDDGYPKVIRLTDGHCLKLTKTSLKKAIDQEIHSGYLEI